MRFASGGLGNSLPGSSRSRLERESSSYKISGRVALFHYLKPPLFELFPHSPLVLFLREPLIAGKPLVLKIYYFPKIFWPQMGIKPLFIVICGPINNVELSYPSLYGIIKEVIPGILSQSFNKAILNGLKCNVEEVLFNIFRIGQELLRVASSDKPSTSVFRCVSWYCSCC